MEKVEFIDTINTLKKAGWLWVSKFLEITEEDARKMQFRDPGAHFDRWGLRFIPCGEHQLRACAKTIRDNTDIAKFKNAESDAVNILHLRSLPNLWLSYEDVYVEDVMTGREVTREQAQAAPRMDADLNIAYVRDPDDWDSFAPLSQVFPTAP